MTVGATAAVVLLVVAASTLAWFLESRHFEKTDDAFVGAHYEMVAPRVSGQVIKVHVDDNAVVESGQVLLEIDPSDYQVALDRAKAAVLQAEAQVTQNRAQRQFAVAGVEQAKADLDLAQANAENANAQLHRYEGLSEEAVSAQQLDNLRTTARTANAQLVAARTRLPSQTAQVDVATGQISAADANLISAKKAQVQAELNLSYTSVRAITGGRVTQRQVQAGDYVSPGQQLIILVPRDVYVTANYKETQITDMQPGQPVDIKVDGFPNETFRGKIDSIQRGSGTVFSLLPPQNATGNYVKVVQRVPVKITFDSKNGAAYERLGPGMSVEPSVRVR